MPFFQVSDGTRLSYEDYGAGTPLVFVASWALNADMWEYQVPYFVERGFRCVLLDRRGHGRSDRPSSGYDVDTRADDLATLIEQLDLRDITLIAHSAGGGEAARYLVRHGEERVSRVAFLSSTLPYLKLTDDNPEGIPVAAHEAMLAQLGTDRPKWFADRAQGFFATHLGNDVSPALIENEVRRCLSTAPFASAETLKSMYHEDFRADLRQITIPALIVHGVADQSAPIDVTSRRTRKLVPHAVYQEYPTAGHGLYVTHAEQLNAEILEFVTLR